MSDLFDALPGGAPRAGVVDAMSWEDFWSRVARVTPADGAREAPERADGELTAEWVAPGGGWLSPRRPADEDEDDEDDEDDDDDEDDEDDEDEAELDADDLDDLDDLDEDDEEDEDDEDLDEDLDDDEFDDDLVDLDDEYDTEDEERHRGGSDYEEG